MAATKIREAQILNPTTKVSTGIISTSPPSSPADGDVWVYPVSGYGNPYWMFVYDSSETTYKWKFIGGGSAAHKVDTDEAITMNSTWQDLSTVGPTITVPRAGDYTYEFGCDLYNNADVKNIGMGLKIGGAAMAGPDAVLYNNNGGTFSEYPAYRHGYITGVAASTVLKCQYLAAAGAPSAQARWRILRIAPVRII